MSSSNSRELLQRFRDGDSRAAGEVYDRYIRRLIGLVRQKMSPKLRRRVDAEDIVQSAYRSFFVHARDDEYVFERAGDLWRLLAAIALHKLHGQIERHTAARRDVGREHVGEVDDKLIAARSEDVQPTADEAVALAEQVSLALRRLSPIARQAIELRLCGETIDAIAAAIGRSPRTVRRLVDNARREMEAILAGEGVAKWAKASVRWPADPRATFSYADFTLEQLVGAGGMGKVYRATQQSTGRQVAVKALHKKWQQDRRLVETFVQEAVVMSRLDHPHIVKLLGLGQFPSGGYFLAMDFYGGKNLQSTIDDGRVTLAGLIAIFRQVVSAVGYAHEHGIVHCDIKPANVLLDDAGRAAVADFGFAQYMTNRGHDSGKPPIVGGTSGYIAPELFAGDQLQIAPTADIFSLGALLHTMIVGHAPTGRAVPIGIVGERESCDIQLGFDQVPIDVAAGLRAICEKCLAAEPANRYQSAAEILSELDKLPPQINLR